MTAVKNNKKEALTFRNALKHERKDFGQVKPYTMVHKSPKDYDRKREKKETRKRIAEE